MCFAARSNSFPSEVFARSASAVARIVVWLSWQLAAHAPDKLSQLHRSSRGGGFQVLANPGSWRTWDQTPPTQYVTPPRLWLGQVEFDQGVRRKCGRTSPDLPTNNMLDHKPQGYFERRALDQMIAGLLQNTTPAPAQSSGADFGWGSISPTSFAPPSVGASAPCLQHDECLLTITTIVPWAHALNLAWTFLIYWQARTSKRRNPRNSNTNHEYDRRARPPPAQWYRHACRGHCAGGRLVSLGTDVVSLPHLLLKASHFKLQSWQDLTPSGATVGKRMDATSIWLCLV